MKKSKREQLRGHAPWIIGAFALGAVVSISAVAGAASDPFSLQDAGISLSPEKQAAVESASPVDTTDNEFGSLELLTPFDDAGSEADIRAVKDALPNLVDLRLSAGRIPESAASRGLDAMQNFVDSPKEAQQRVQALRDSVVPADLKEAIELSERGIKDAIQQEHIGWRYLDNRFEVLNWEGIRVEGDKATIMVRAVQSYLDADRSWVSDPEEQAVFTLQRAEGSKYGWLLESKSALRVEDAVPSDRDGAEG